MYRFNAIPIKIPAIYFMKTDKMTLRFIWKDKKTCIAKTILKQKNKVGGLMTPGFRTCYQATVIRYNDIDERTDK